MTATPYNPTRTLSDAIDRADQIVLIAYTIVCGHRRRHAMPITREYAQQIATGCPGDQTGDRFYGLNGDGWTYGRTGVDGPLVLTFDAPTQRRDRNPWATS